jgi:hypothetical protein
LNPFGDPHTTASPSVDQFTVFEVEAVAAPGKSIATSAAPQAECGVSRFMERAYRGLPRLVSRRLRYRYPVIASASCTHRLPLSAEGNSLEPRGHQVVGRGLHVVS